VDEQVEEVRAVYQEAQRRKKGAEEIRYCMDNGVWRPIRPDDPEDIELFLDIYRKDGRLFEAILHELSGSGDWSRSTEYYFRQDDSLAFIFRTLSSWTSTDNSPITVEMRAYFSPNGAQVRETKKLLNPSTNQPISGNPGYFAPENLPEIYPSSKEMIRRLNIVLP